MSKVKYKEGGFYWVMLYEEWTVGNMIASETRFGDDSDGDFNHWTLVGTDGWYHQRDFSKIDPTPIKRKEL